ncbi:MAG TPA: glycosyltransferase, partial [Acetobacteraceae bacterium]|nr:glycosyltransferase [Acetobacteraceae bacterium]
MKLIAAPALHAWTLSETPSETRSRTRLRRAFPHRTILLSLAICALLAGAWWWTAHHPLPVPSYRGEVGQPWKTSFASHVADYLGLDTLGRHPNWPRWAAGAMTAGLLLAWVLLGRRADLGLPGKLLIARISRRYMPRPAPAGTRLPKVSIPKVSIPKVSIHVPVCNEPPTVVRETLDALARLDYPDFEVLVVENNTSDPALWEPVAEHCARLGPRFRFFHLGSWPGFKAGALNFALQETAADAAIIGVIDSGCQVSPGWLRAMVPAFADPEVGFAQSPQECRDNDGTLFKRLMFREYAGFFRRGMATRNEGGAIIGLGAMTLIRLAAVRAAGGWAEWCITEDSELGLRLLRWGWQPVYARESFGAGLMPDDFTS